MRFVKDKELIVLADLSSYGHHQIYMEVFSRVLLNIGYRVLVLYPDPGKMICWADRELSNSDRSRFSSERVNILHRRGMRSRRYWVLNRWLAVRRAIRAAGVSPSLVFYTWVDNFRLEPDKKLISNLILWVLPFLFPWRWGGLYFHPVHLRGLLGDGGKHSADFDIDTIFSLPNCSGVAVLDEGIVGLLNRKVRAPVMRFPDFGRTEITVDQGFATKISKLAGDRTIIGMLGALQRRKGVLDYLGLINSMDPDQYYFLFCGEIDRASFSDSELSDLELFIRRSPENVFIYNEFMDEKSFDAAFSKCDVVYAVYKDFPHSSNILFKAAVHKIPVLVAKGLCMGERVRQWGLGKEVVQGSTAEIVKAIEELASDGNERNYSGYVSANSISKLHEVMGEFLRKTRRPGVDRRR